MAKKRVLICDDEPGIRKALTEILEDDDYGVFTCETGEELIYLLKKAEQTLHAIFLDVWLPGQSGVEILSQIRAIRQDIPVIMISGHATMEVAVQATKLGAFDFLEKPLSIDRILLTLQNALRQSQLEQRQKHLTGQIEQPQLIGTSAPIVKLSEDILMAGPSPGRVLILGESGAGKEVTAKLLHQNSNRSEEPFIEVNCAAIPEELIESELFGHVKGSFTGAIDHRVGKFELADGGTLFLDEIGDMSLNTQAKVLRVLQDQRFQKIGGSKTIHVDVRVIAATNKNLEEEIKKGHFREDLFFRLSVIPIRVPSLRERPQDIPLLCEFFSQEFSREYGRDLLLFEPKTLHLLQSYSWPGNVRELKNIIERLMIMSRGPRVKPGDLPPEIKGSQPSTFHMGPFDSLKEARDHFEKHYISLVLEQNNFNVTKTAEILKIERSNLHRKLKQLEIEIRGKHESADSI